MNYQELNSIERLQFMPVRANKQPIVKGWQSSTEKHDLSACDAVGLVCGNLSGGLEVIDLDCKYSLDGKLYDNFKSAVHKADKTLLAKLLVQTTKNGGYHMIYRCATIAGNQKLANRNTTDEEKRYTYDETYKTALLDPKNKSDEEAKTKAEKASENDKIRVLIETRGEGGYIMCFPSKGYELVNLDFYGINEITPEERETLHNVSRQFNEVFVEYVPQKYKAERIKGLSPFDDYNQRGDVVMLLENHGWKVVGQKGKKTLLLRPGQTSAASSGNFDHEKNWFSVFSTSTEFKEQTAYLPYAVFAMLECNKDYTEANKRLYEMGYGDRREEGNEKEKAPSTRVIQSRINPNDNDYSFLATQDDYNPYLQQFIDGTLPMGKSTGMAELDEHFLFKEGNMVSLNGVDNVGKTDLVWWLLMIAALYHDWCGIVFASENTIGSFMRRMIQFYWGKPLVGQYAMNEKEYQIAKEFVESHWKIIKAQEDLYNYKDIINMIRKARAKYPNLKYGMIDPYNSLKIDLSGFSKLSTHEYHYEALSELKAYGQQSKFGWFINHHAYTGAARKKDGENKYVAPPGKEDTEGGQKVANKTDDFITIHRVTNHPTEWMITDLHVRKIKDTDTGGRPTSKDNPIRLKMYRNRTAFHIHLEGNGIGTDPIMRYHQMKGDYIQHTIFPTEPTVEVRMPYKEEDSNLYQNDYLENLKDDNPF